MYQVKVVYVNLKIAEYYIINASTRKVQSVWKCRSEAQKIARMLNSVIG